MEIHMKETSSMAKRMVKVFIIGQTERSTMENGKKVSKMDTECGEVYLVIVTWDNGLKVKLMVTVSINGKTATGTKDRGLNVSSMEKEQTFFKMVICTLVITHRASHLAKVSINGKMVVFIVESSRMA